MRHRLAASAALYILLLSYSVQLCLAAVPIKPPNFRTAADARHWGEAQQRQGNLSSAAVAFDIEAAMYDKLGDHQAAFVERRRSRRMITDLLMAVPSASAPITTKPAKLEPLRGCYLGVRDDPNGHYYGKPEAGAEDLARRLERPVTIALDYNLYGRPFPTEWATREKERGRAVQIAWEPGDIASVEENDYLTRWAQDAGKSGAAVFLRFAGEMNGAWTLWGRNPTLYRRKFRLVHDVMARYAPNVAMVWAPNAVPIDKLDAYYPGDDAVDWVGISLYLVRFYDDNLKRPAWQDSPAFFIEPFYRKYAARKPLCLVECGVTRRSWAENTNADAYAAARIQDLFDAIKIRYPRLKMACLFDRNNIVNAIPGRQLNDFALPAGSQVLAAMKREASDPYFLTAYEDNATAPVGYITVRDNFPTGYQGLVAASLITYALQPKLEIKRTSGQSTVARPYEFGQNGTPGTITVTVRDEHGHSAQTQTVFAR